MPENYWTIAQVTWDEETQEVTIETQLDGEFPTWEEASAKVAELAQEDTENTVGEGFGYVLKPDWS